MAISHSQKGFEVSYVRVAKRDIGARTIAYILGLFAFNGVR
jgi:hypothetical protein